MSKLKNLYQDFLNIRRVKTSTPNLENLKVTLKKSKKKGTGLFATKPIKKGETIAYYKITAFDEDQYVSPTDYVYTFTVYTKSGRSSKSLIGDIDLKSIPPPKNNIPFWGFYANEPSGKQEANAEIDENLGYNYRNRRRVKEGDSLIYKLKAKRTIRPKEEITWYYGEDYERDYNVNVPEDEK